MRYILLVKEDQEYKTLKTDEERGSFIEKFWAALDPTPNTPVNERRVEFWKRVEEANQQFREGLAQGWRTDRGKVFILLGPPDGRDPRGTYEVWKYQALPREGASPEVTVRFRRTSEGEYHMGRGALEYWDPTAGSDGPAAGDSFLAVRGKGGSPEMMTGRIRMTEFPQATVSAELIMAPLDVLPRFDFYKAEKGDTRVVLTLGVPVDEYKGADGHYLSPDIQLSVSLEDVKSGKKVGNFRESMVVADVGSKSLDRPMLVQGSFSIEPGTYKATFSILDRQSHHGLSRAETITAPDFDKDLMLSSLVVGRLPAGSKEGAPSAKPGSAKPGRPEASTLTPDPRATFRAGETVSFAYQVYNAHVKGGAPDLDVEYRFSIETKDGPRQIGKPIVLQHQSSTALAYSLVLQGWPEAAYHVQVRVTDDRSGHTAVREEPFTVAASLDTSRLSE